MVGETWRAASITKLNLMKEKIKKKNFKFLRN